MQYTESKQTTQTVNMAQLLGKAVLTALGPTVIKKLAKAVGLAGAKHAAKHGPKHGVKHRLHSTAGRRKATAGRRRPTAGHCGACKTKQKRPCAGKKRRHR